MSDIQLCTVPPTQNLNIHKMRISQSQRYLTKCLQIAPFSNFSASASHKIQKFQKHSSCSTKHPTLQTPGEKKKSNPAFVPLQPDAQFLGSFLIHLMFKFQTVLLQVFLLGSSKERVTAQPTFVVTQIGTPMSLLHSKIVVTGRFPHRIPLSCIIHGAGQPMKL